MTQDVDVELLTAPPRMAAMYAQAAKGALVAQRPATPPGQTVMLVDQEQSLDRYAAYARETGFRLRDAVPATWLHTQTFGLQLHLLTSPRFPVKALGLVHITNVMRQYRPVLVGERLTLSARCGLPLQHRAGTAYPVHCDVRVGDEVVWEGQSVHLARGQRAPVDAPAVPDLAIPAPPSVDDQAGWRWKVGADTGRRFARVSGDSNPIHVSALAAKAFGFPRAIAHGMWSHARLLSAVERDLPESYAVAVGFRKPVFLPSTVRVTRSGPGFGAGQSGDGASSGIALAMTSKDGAKEHVRALVADVGADFAPEGMTV